MIEHRVRLGDVDVQCIESDNAEERTFVILHGAQFNSTIWSRVNTLKLLEAYGISFVAPDMPGSGRQQEAGSTWRAPG